VDGPESEVEGLQECAGAAIAVSTRPATLSLVLAILLRLSPLGMDMLAVASETTSPQGYVCFAGHYYVFILLPLVYMLARHGRAAWRWAPKHILATLLIVVVSLTLDAWMVHDMVTGDIGARM
jgi:heme/copper-type cytochrome/quinol oxidase subunit 4